MSALTLNDDVFRLPDSWDDLTSDQFIKIANLSTLNLSPEEFKFYLLIQILNMEVPKERSHIVDGERCYKMRCYKKNYIISATDLAFVCIHSLGFLFTEKRSGEKIQINIDCKLNRTLVKHISVDGELWIGPGDCMNNIIYEEYCRALVSASEYSETKNLDSLNKLIATLYRPAKKLDDQSGDLRVPFNDFIVDQEAKKLSKVPDEIKFAVLLQLNGHLWNLAKTFEHAFNKGAGAKSKAKTVFMQQLDIIDNLANHKIPEKEQIRKSQLYDVLHTLDNLIKTSPKKK